MERTSRYRRLTLVVCSLILLPPLFVLATVLSYAIVLVASGLPAARLALANRSQPAGQRAPYPAGWWQRHGNAADGYTLAMPPDWRVLPLAGDAAPSAESAESGEAAVAQRLASWARERTDAGWGIWVAVAPDGALGDVTTINVVRQPLDHEMPVEAFAEANLAALREGVSVSGPVSQQWLTFTAGRALRTQTVYRFPDRRSQVGLLSMTQLYLVQGQNGYVVTGVTRPEQAGAYAPIFDGIARSLRWTT